jgi:hypothetical protein
MAERQPPHGKEVVATATAGAFRDLSPPQARDPERQDSARRDPARGTRKRGSCDRESGRLQGSVPPQAGIKRQETASAVSCLRARKMHRVGLASVQLTRSTFAEAIAGRESLQPRALRARCNPKATAPFDDRQAISGRMLRKLRHFPLRGCFALLVGPDTAKSTQKCTEAGAPSSGLPTDLRRSDCLSESHQPPALRPRCTQDTRASRRCRQAPSNDKYRSLRLSLYKPNILASSRLCSTWTGPRIRRAGCAFVHFPG